MTDPNSVKRRLPLLPHPDHLRKQAKARLAALKLGAPDCRLADAQRALAQEYGFATWAALQAEVARRATTPAARQIRTRRRGATLHTRKTSGCASELVVAFLPARRRARGFLAHPDEGPLPPMDYFRAGVLIQVCFAVAALIGVGIVCFVLTRAGPALTATELLHKVI
jgi:hypothetical protein